MSAKHLREAFGVALIAAALLAGACGIDFVGSHEVATPSGGSDAAVDDAALPAACKTLDASCLGVLPDMWKPVALGAPGCSAGFTSVSLLENARTTAGSCACGACRPTAAFTCAGNVSIAGGNNCGDTPIAQAQSGVCKVAHAQHLMAGPPQASGSAACAAPNDAGTGATADSLAVCVPGCEADFCASPSQCVIAEGDQACPSGLTLRTHVGTGADPGCPPCECEAGARGKCSGTVTAFANTTCADSGLVETYDVATCNQFSSGDYDSVLVKLVPPDASCFPVPADAAAQLGDASLTGTKTICCK